jgi:hypothetical protein
LAFQVYEKEILNYDINSTTVGLIETIVKFKKIKFFIGFKAKLKFKKFAILGQFLH